MTRVLAAIIRTQPFPVVFYPVRVKTVLTSRYRKAPAASYGNNNYNINFLENPAVENKKRTHYDTHRTAVGRIN